jgi:hypothetical protein
VEVGDAAAVTGGAAGGALVVVLLHALTRRMNHRNRMPSVWHGRTAKASPFTCCRSAALARRPSTGSGL